MAAKKYMTSYYVLYACFAVIILTFAVFFGYGYDNPEGDYNAPVCTEGLMWLMYNTMLQQLDTVDILKKMFTFVPFDQLLLPMIVTFFGAGLFVGVVGSWTSIRKFLNV